MATLKNKFVKIGEGETGPYSDPLGGDQPRLVVLPIEQVEPDPDQPRKDVGDLEDLKASISEHGILQPCIVSVVEEDRYRLIAGERRYSAAKALGIKAIPCILRTIDEHRRLEVQLIENIHRKELNAIEEATTYDRLMKEFNLSQRDLAKRLGKSPATINQTLRILSLPARLLESVQTSERLTRSVLLEIAKLESEEEQIRLYELATTGLLTVKAARAKKEKGIDKPQRARVPIQTTKALVTVTFTSGDSSSQDLADALAEALAIAQSQ